MTVDSKKASVTVWTDTNMNVAADSGDASTKLEWNDELGAYVHVFENRAAEDGRIMVFVELSRDLFPPVVTGVLLSAIIAASMSTADSQLLVASSSFTSDIYKPVMRKNASDKEILWVGRAVVLVVAVVAYFIASSEGDGAQAIMDLVSNAWAGFGSAFGSVVILSVFWRRFTYKGALAGVIVGAVVDVVWLLTGLSGTLYELVPGFACSMIAAVVVTLLDRAPAKEVTDIFDAAVADVDD
jgi:sodium/proline symporter